MHQMMTLAKQGKLEEATALNKPLEALHQKLFLETNPIPAKWAASQMGLIKNASCRPPLDELDPSFEPEVLAALQAAGLM
jgi:4-hydroxy-tetrahydrodipicolinate synthase